MTTTTQTLDWRDIAPEPELHSCDCEHCHLTGEPEDVDPAFLLVMDVDGEQYVTDRFMAIKIDRAPLPEHYGGPMLPPIEKRRVGFMADEVSGTPANRHRFRDSITKALLLTGWTVWELDTPPTADDRDRRAVAIMDAEDNHIGWAIAREIAQ